MLVRFPIKSRLEIREIIISSPQRLNGGIHVTVSKADGSGASR